MTEERETEHVTGVVGSIILKGESKWQIEVTPAGSQYAKKLWTKSQGQVETATGLIGQTATFECGVSHWTNQEGKPVRSLWVNAINPDTLPQTSAAAPPLYKLAPAGDPRQESIERQVALKAAVDFTSAGSREPKVQDVLAAAEAFDNFLATPRPAPGPVSELVPDDNPPEPGMGLDQDIPFL